MILIDLFDTDVVNTLVPAFSLKPDLEYMVVDKRHRSMRLFQSIVKTIQNRIGTKIVIVEVDAKRVDDIDRKLRELIDLKQDEQVYLDLAGGRELLTACGFRYAMERSVTPIYMDFKKDRLYSVLDNSEVGPIVPLTIEDYLEAIGAKRLASLHSTPNPKNFDRIVEMAEILFAHEAAWDKLCKRIATSTKHFAGPMQFRKDLKFSGEERKLLEHFLKLGFLKENEQAYLHVNEQFKSYLTTYGSWLEMYVYIKASALFPEAAMSVVIDWIADDNDDAHDNEIDVLFMKKSVPVFVSCKMTRPTADDVNEVLTLARRFGGRRAKAIIATTFDVESVQDQSTGIYKRMRKLNCGYIETKDFRKKPDREVFNKALQMSD